MSAFRPPESLVEHRICGIVGLPPDPSDACPLPSPAPAAFPLPGRVAPSRDRAGAPRSRGGWRLYPPGEQVRPDRNRVAFQTAILELKDGQFRYWFQSDAKFGEEPIYPQTGKYAVEGGKVTIEIKIATMKGFAGGPPRDFFRTEVWQFMKYEGKTVLWPTKPIGPPKGGAPPHNVLFRTYRQAEDIWQSKRSRSPAGGKMRDIVACVGPPRTLRIIGSFLHANHAPIRHRPRRPGQCGRRCLQAPDAANRALLRERLGFELPVRKIAVRDPATRARSRRSPAGS